MEGARQPCAPSSSPRHFPAAAQPDIVRAVQKDSLCASMLEGALTDVVQGLLGPAAVFRHREALRVLTSAMYFGTSTGLGQQTLGEEYCDLMQVAASRLQPTTRSAAVQVLTQALGPSLLAWLPSALPDEECSQVESPPHKAAQPRVLFSSAHDAAQSNGHDAGEPPDRHACDLALDTLTSLSTSPSASHLASPALSERGRRAACQPPPPSTAQRAGAAALAVGRRMRVWLRTNQAQASQWLLLLPQLHLALFYVYGRHFQVSKRVSGATYVYIGSSFQPRPYYGIMGVLLLLQIAAQVWQLTRPASRKEADVRADAALVVLPHGSEQRAPPLVARKHSQEHVQDYQKCPLCLSARAHPCATKCGHLFCWECIVKWCQQKPECPICRTPSTVQSLVPAVHVDF